MGVKKGLYEAVGVREYVLFDPREEYLLPRFQVFRSENATFVPCLTPEHVGYTSELGLTLRVIDGVLRIFDSENRALPTPAELGGLVHREPKAAEQARGLAEKLSQQLRAAGLEPEL